MRTLVVVAGLLVACNQHSAAPPPQQPSSIASWDTGASPEAGGRRDCTVDAMIAARTGGALPSCGRLERHVTPAERAAAADCVAKALAAHAPFTLREELPGIDSRVEAGAIGVVEAGAYRTYTLFYDSDRTGGMHPETGETSVTTCETLTPDDCLHGERGRVTDCLRCAHPTVATACVRGGKVGW